MGCGPVKDPEKGNMHKPQEDKIEISPQFYEANNYMLSSEPVVENASPPPPTHELEVTPSDHEKEEVNQQPLPAENELPPANIKEEEVVKEVIKPAEEEHKQKEEENKQKEEEKTEPKVQAKAPEIKKPKPTVTTTEQKLEEKKTIKASVAPKKKVQVIKPPAFDKAVFKYKVQNDEFISEIRRSLDSYQPIAEESKFDAVGLRLYKRAFELHKWFNDLITDPNWKFCDKGKTWEGYNMSNGSYICSKSGGQLDFTPIEVN